MINTISLSNFQISPTAAISSPKLYAPISTLAMDRTCTCPGDGMIAFGLPWMAVTALGTLATLHQGDSAFLIQAVLPGLIAGGTGLASYKATKKLLKVIRRSGIPTITKQLLKCFD